ncbi:MAG: glycoside hydrolase family 26 protein [Negativicutes bacterium]|nr:glycoside hydrolase family 26 protein [Negativicutes bacterium]
MNKLLSQIIAASLAAMLLSTLPPSLQASAGGTAYLINGIPQAENTASPQDDLKAILSCNEEMVQYTDYAHGYSLLIPSGMQPDLTYGTVRTVFAGPEAQIEIYYDDFRGTISNADAYVYYGNRPLYQSPYFTVTEDVWEEVNGIRVHLLSWNRPKLARLANDKNHYVSAEFIKNAHEVYTVFIKSTRPFAAYRTIIDSFFLTGRQGTPRNYPALEMPHRRLSAETSAFWQKYFAPEASLTWGVFEPSAPENLNYLADLENKVDFKFPFLLRYQGIDEQAPVRGLLKAFAEGRYVELTLQTVLAEEANALVHTERSNAHLLYAILDGRYDDYFHAYARKLKDFGHPVLFRLNNEMNGDWCWYSAYYTGKDTEIYKAVWRYIHTIFDQNGADNVLWVWNPHDVSRPDFKWNHAYMYYPGDEYVDIIGLTGYNTGTYFPGEHWREFAAIYDPLYAAYSSVFAKPFMITEFGSNSTGGNKVAWLETMFGQIRRYPNIKVAIWWNGIDYDRAGNPGRVYLLDESQETTAVFRKRLQEFR